MQHEVIAEQDLLNEKGIIKEPGWARKPVWKYQREAIRAPWFRRKEWDYYLITNAQYGVAFTISDLGYAGLISASFLDFEKKEETTKTRMEAFPRKNKYELSTNSNEEHCFVKSKAVHMSFIKEGNQRSIRCKWKHFLGEEDLVAVIWLTEPAMDSMCIATNWREKPTAFYYNEKKNCMPARGKVKIGDREILLEEKSAFGVLDWGRGVWTYDNTWYWCTGSGMLDGKPFGFNLGYGFSDRSQASENVIFYNGVAHKLDEVTFHIQKNSKKEFLFEKTWKITSFDGRISGFFEPILDRKAEIDLKCIISNQHQVFGRMQAQVVLDDGTALLVKDFLCAIEVVHNRY
ncbi:MAG: hypothetical protein PWP24_1727 [Clostridiales bacterium]|nr:hypothetical protein [Clostridiales bacterium]